MRASIPLLALTLLCGAAHAQTATTLCDLLRNPDKYEGQLVKVRATYRYGYEWEQFYCLDCLDLDSNDADAYLQLAVLYGENGKWEESLAAGKRLVDLRPKDETGYHVVGGAYQELKEYSQAIEAYNQTLQINPESIPAFGGLADAYICTARYDEALVALQKAITIDPSAPDPHGWLAQSYSEMGNPEAAAEEIAILRKLDPELAADIEKAVAPKPEGAKSLDNC